MRWIVDGMNLIGSRPDGWWRDRPGARARLVSRLGQLVEQPGVDPVAVVFDGQFSSDDVAAGDLVGVSVSFASGGRNAADRVIAEMVRIATDPTEITVVTSDSALAAQVRQLGATVMSVSGFRQVLGDEPN